MVDLPDDGLLEGQAVVVEVSHERTAMGGVVRKAVTAVLLQQ